MAQIARKAEELGHQLASACVARRWLTVFLCFLTVMLGAYGGSRLSFSGDYQVFFSDENPELQAFLNFEATYGKADNISFVIIPDSGTIYTPEVMAAIHQLTDQAWKIPYVSRVDSVTNFQHSYAEGDDLIVEDLVYELKELEAPGRLKEIRKIVEAEPLLHRYVVDEQGRATLVNAVLQVDRSNPDDVAATVAKAREIRDSIVKDHPGLTIKLTGISMLSSAFSEVAQLDSQTLIPAMYLLITVVMLIVIRSFTATLSALFLIFFSTAFGMGVAGWMGIELTPISISAPTIILTIAVADAVHIIAAMRQRMRAGMEKTTAIIEATAANSFPVTITSLTTIIGFLSLNFSGSPPFHHLGNITAVGIMMAWLLSLTFLPAMLRIMPVRYKAVPQEMHDRSLMLRFGSWVLNRRKRLFAATVAISVAAMAMIPRIEFNDVWSKYFAPDISIRQAIDATQPFFGTDNIEFVLDSGAPGNVLEPAFLHEVAAFTDWLEAREETRHIYSLSHIMKRLNRNLNQDDPAFYRIPQNQKKASQYLLVYELSLPYGLDLNDRIDIDREKTRISVTLKDLSTTEARALSEEAVAWFNAKSQIGATAIATGATPLFNYIADRNIQSMLEGAIFLIFAIFAIMALSFKSLQIGILSVLLNAIPILATFGFWAILVGQVGFSIAIVGAVAIGLVIDDSVHILSKYMVAKRHQGKSFEDSVRYAFGTAGVAILSTTIILGVGFALLTTSSFKPNLDLGLMTAMAIMLAMVVNFFTMPALLDFMNPEKGETS